MTGTTYGFGILHQCDKCVKTKRQGVLRAISCVNRSFGRKTDRGVFLPLPILNRVKKKHIKIKFPDYGKIKIGKILSKYKLNT